MFGAEMRWPEREAKRREEDALAAAGLSREHLERFRRAGEGARRAYRVLVRDASIEGEGDVATVRFTLPPGAYATEVLRELTRGGAVERRARREDTPGPSDSR
jgi:tRNA pseudouridine13 synthase